jgi:hypothetical protein
MKTLYELANNSRYSKIVEVFMPQEENSPLKKLFSIVNSDKFLDDEMAMLAIYGRRNLSAFSRVKSRLKDILIKAILLQNTTMETEHSRVNEAMNQYRHALVSKFLAQRKITHLAIDIAEKALIKSMKYHSTENVLLLVRILIRHYGSAEYNKYKLNKYLEIQKKFSEIDHWEVKAENYFLDLQRTQLNSLATPSDSTKAKAKKYVEELEMVKGIHTYFFYTFKYKVKAAYYEYQKDYEALLKLSDATLKELSTPDLRSNFSAHNINLRKAWALIQAERYEDAVLIGKKDLAKLPSGSLGWYFIAHYTLKAELYQGHYDKAIDLITQMVENPKFSRIGENYRELFYTTLGYIYLIIDSKLFDDLNIQNKRLPEFKLYKFLNTIPVFSKDKRGINVSILLMHIAFLLQRKDYNAIIDRVDSLNQYAYRYLRKDDSFRSNCMIKMVIQMTKADFNPIRTARYTQDLLKQLEQVKLAGSGENIETEIIPYEVLWKIMTKSL